MNLIIGKALKQTMAKVQTTKNRKFTRASMSTSILDAACYHAYLKVLTKKKQK